MGGFLHCIKTIWKIWDGKVSVPSRGMGGFLLKDFYGQSKSDRFPSPLEVWVVSYSRGYHRMSSEDYCFRPLSRYGWFPTLFTTDLDCSVFSSFRPLSRYGWFPTPYLVPQKGINTQDSSHLETILSIPYFTRAFS